MEKATRERFPRGIWVPSWSCCCRWGLSRNGAENWVGRTTRVEPGWSEHRSGTCRYVRRFRAPTPMETSPMMAIAEGTGFLVRSIVATANATINPPTSIIATPLLFRFSVTSASFHAGFWCSSPEQTKVIRYVHPVWYAYVPMPDGRWDVRSCAGFDDSGRLVAECTCGADAGLDG